MKLLSLLGVISILFLQATHAQNPSDQYKFYDVRWQPAKEKKAVYLLRIRHIGDSCWQYSYYNIFGPLIRIETYQDPKATIRHGLFAWYNEEGKLDSSGYYDLGTPNGDWHYPGIKDKINVYYEKGKLLNEKEFTEKIRSMEIPDPAFPDLSRESPEAYFPGGQAGWIQYLNKNLRYPERAVSNLVKGTVKLLFVVGPTGKVSELQVLQSIELSLDDEALRLIHESPDWIPAIKIDRRVRAFKIQPFTFQLQVGK